MECVEACVALDGSDPTASEPTAATAPDASSAQLEADPEPQYSELRCPEPPFPCERLCWELDARFGRGRPTTLSSIDTTDDTDLATIGEPLIRCAEERAAECRATEAANLSESTPSEGTAGERLGWTDAFLECAGLPADLGLLD